MKLILNEHEINLNCPTCGREKADNFLPIIASFRHPNCFGTKCIACDKVLVIRPTEGLPKGQKVTEYKKDWTNGNDNAE